MILNNMYLKLIILIRVFSLVQFNHLIFIFHHANALILLSINDLISEVFYADCH